MDTVNVSAKFEPVDSPDPEIIAIKVLAGDWGTGVTNPKSWRRL